MQDQQETKKPIRKAVITPPRYRLAQGSTMRLAARAQVLRLYSAGRTSEQIGNMLGYSQRQVERYLNEALDKLVRYYAKASPQHTFVRYASFQLEVIKKLQETYENIVTNQKSRQYSAAISALKTQSDIYDKVIEKGQEYGVISQKKADKTILDSPRDLQITLRNEITVLSKLLDEVDTHDEFRKRRRYVANPKSDGKIAKIRKVKRNALGFVRDIPDWKYRSMALDSRGHKLRKDEITPVMQLEHIPVLDQQKDDLEFEKLEQEYERAKAGREKPKPKPPIVYPLPKPVPTTKQLLSG